MRVAPLVALYLVAIVAANLSLYHFGPPAAIYNAFALIGLDLTTRDRLHDVWQRHRALKFVALIAAGSALSYVTNTGTARIAAASCAAFACAAAVDTLAYHVLRRREWFERANGSNLASAAVDSLLFLPLAGYGWPWPIIFGLFCAKVAGGFVWSLIVRGRRVAPAPA